MAGGKKTRLSSTRQPSPLCSNSPRLRLRAKHSLTLLPKPNASTTRRSKAFFSALRNFSCPITCKAVSVVDTTTGGLGAVKPAKFSTD